MLTVEAGFAVYRYVPTDPEDPRPSVHLSVWPLKYADRGNVDAEAVFDEYDGELGCRRSPDPERLCAAFRFDTITSVSPTNLGPGEQFLSGWKLWAMVAFIVMALIGFLVWAMIGGNPSG